MVWTINYTDTAVRILRKMDKSDAKKIIAYMEDIATLADPRTRGKGLTANFSGYWRYRVGDRRIICNIKDDQLMIIAIRIAHRSEAYD